MIASRIESMLPPVERSITVSEPSSMAIFSLASSLSTFEVTAELPMFALILQRALMPMPIGCEAEAEMDLVRRDDHPPACDFGPDQLGIEILAPGHELHFGRDDALVRHFNLSHDGDVLAKPIARLA